jgi:hypothetical protein
MTRLALPVLLFCLIAACSSTEEQAADPAKVERLLASLESGSDTGLSPATETRLRKADRLAGAIARVEPKRIDPKLAVALLAR